jgi:hypothetical protein
LHLPTEAAADGVVFLEDLAVEFLPIPTEDQAVRNEAHSIVHIAVHFILIEVLSIIIRVQLIRIEARLSIDNQ